MPGITREELERRNAAGLKIAESPGIEVMPGVTREEMLRKNAEALKTSPPWYVESMKQQAKQAASQPPVKPQFPPAEEK